MSIGHAEEYRAMAKGLRRIKAGNIHVFFANKQLDVLSISIIASAHSSLRLHQGYFSTLDFCFP
jgi:hypothetical protein